MDISIYLFIYNVLIRTVWWCSWIIWLGYLLLNLNWCKYNFQLHKIFFLYLFPLFILFVKDSQCLCFRVIRTFFLEVTNVSYNISYCRFPRDIISFDKMLKAWKRYIFLFVTVKLIWENSVRAASKNCVINWTSLATRCVCTIAVAAAYGGTASYMEGSCE
jgi:hypothetical protein